MIRVLENLALFWVSFLPSLSLHSQHIPGRNLADCGSFYGEFPPLPMCFEPIWSMPFLGHKWKQPTNESRMKQQCLPSMICFRDNPLSVSALTRERSRWLSGVCFLLLLFQKYRGIIILDWTANFRPCFWQILHHCRLRREGGWAAHWARLRRPQEKNYPWLSPRHGDNSAATHTLSVFNLTHGSTFSPCSYRPQ